LIFSAHAGGSAAPWSTPSDPITSAFYLAPQAVDQSTALFCGPKINVRVGDTIDLRSAVQNSTNPSSPVDWSVMKFTYTLAGANDPPVPADWNLASFNNGTPVTITEADLASPGNQGESLSSYHIFFVLILYTFTSCFHLIDSLTPIPLHCPSFSLSW
jgi:hypothetical protein